MPNTGGSGAGGGDDGSQQGIFLGRVLVARHPIHDPTHVRGFKAVQSPPLRAFLQGRAGVMFFSTQGPRSPASLLSNGDLDGDVYFVLLNETMVLAARPERIDGQASSTTAATEAATAPPATAAAPCPGSERITHVGPFRLNEEPVGYRIDAALMRRCLETCLAQVEWTSRSNK